MSQIIAAPSVHPFGGKDGENFSKFIKQLNSAIAVGKVDVTLRSGFLALHLTGAASDELDALPDAVQADYGQAVESLRRVYENPNKQERHKLHFVERKLQKGETPQTLLTDLRNIVMLAYPDEPPIDATLQDDPRDAAIAARTERQNILEGGRKIRVKEAFVSAMPIAYRERLLHKQGKANVQELCDMVDKSMTIKEIVHKGEYDTFQNVDRPEQPETSGQRPTENGELVAILANLTKEVTEMRAENSKLKEQMNKPQSAQQTTRDVKCYSCQGLGHFSRNCPNNTQQRLQQQQTYQDRPRAPRPPRTEIECYGCGGKGHIKRNCPSNERNQPTNKINQSKN